MDATALDELVSTTWMWVAAPLTAAAALVLTFRLRLPQILRLRDAFASLRAHDAGAGGQLPPASATVLATVAVHGAIAAVAAATAVSLGGAGAIAWVWLFGLLVAPLRVAEAILARTAPAGRAIEVVGSLVGRLLGDPLSALRAIGWALFVLVPCVGFLWFAGQHGEALAGVSAQLSASRWPLWVAVGLGAVIALLPSRRAGALWGWLAVVALLALVTAILIVFLSEPGRAIGGVGRAVSDALEGATNVGAFTGAFVGEVAMAALLYLLPPLLATSGIEGALHGEAQARTTKGQASAALLPSLAYVLVTTLLGLGLVATGAFSTVADDERPMREVRVYRTGFDTASQRVEADRLYSRAIRVLEGEARMQGLELATDRGMIVSPRFEEDGRPADVAMSFVAGRVCLLQRPDEMGALRNRPIAEVDRIVVRGQMLPRGARLVRAGTDRAGAWVTQLALWALIVLCGVAMGAWGLAITRTLSVRLPAIGARAAGLLPALGAAVCGLGLARLGVVSTLAVALLAVLTALVLLARAPEAARLLQQQPSKKK